MDNAIFSRVRPVIDVRVSFADMEQKLYPGQLHVDAPERRSFSYIPRAKDQGDPVNGFCPRCDKLSGRQVALTRDEEDFVYCAGCGWEASWEENGLALTATI